MRAKSLVTLQVEDALRNADQARGACLSDVLAHTGLPKPAARAALCNMVRRGRASYTTGFVPWALRPVAFYLPVDLDAEPAQMLLAETGWFEQLGAALRPGALAA